MKPATALPWHVGLKQAEQIIYGGKGWAVANATVYHGEHDKAETVANASYIAQSANAYPDLLAALEDVELRCTQARIASTIGKGKDRSDFLRGELVRIAGCARAAIAKAKGGQS